MLYLDHPTHEWQALSFTVVLFTRLLNVIDRAAAAHKMSKIRCFFSELEHLKEYIGVKFCTFGPPFKNKERLAKWLSPKEDLSLAL